LNCSPASYFIATREQYRIEAIPMRLNCGDSTSTCVLGSTRSRVSSFAPEEGRSTQPRPAYKK
jgi:hypothetical protein